MPQLARLDAPGVLHHIIIRRIERRVIFRDDFDRENLLKGDERILDDSDFVTLILAEANERLDRYYELKIQGYTIGQVEKRVMEIFGVEKDVIYSKGRRKIQVAARSLLCYWTVRELGLTATELAKRLGLTQPAVRYAFIRGEHMAKERNYNSVS